MEWPFLLQALNLAGRPRQFVDLIRAYVCISHIEVNINGEVDSFFLPKRSLRQGCPISLYLFIIYMEVLSSLLCEIERKGGFRGLRINYVAFAVSHLMFVDDLRIFGEATVGNLETTK